MFLFLLSVLDSFWYEYQKPSHCHQHLSLCLCMKKVHMTLSLISEKCRGVDTSTIIQHWKHSEAPMSERITHLSSCSCSSPCLGLT